MSRDTDGLTPQQRWYRRNRAKAREIHQRWSAAHPGYSAERQRARRARLPGYKPQSRINNERAARALIEELKRAPCTDCGRIFPTECMDFDHVRGTKRFNIGQARSWKIETLREEIAKCDLVCSNCHRIRSFARGQIRKNVA